MDVAERWGPSVGPCGSWGKVEHASPSRGEAEPSAGLTPAKGGDGDKDCLLMADEPQPLRTPRLRFSPIPWSWKKQKISPLVGSGSTEEVHLVEALQEVELGSSRWASLPDHLLDSIFDILKDGKKNDWKHVQGMFQASTVCRSWRRAGRRVFFGRPWKSPTLICHPLQLFSTKPSPLLAAGAGGLLRCFVRREAGGERGSVAKFALYLGSEHHQPDACKFLMAALLNSRWETVLYFTGDCAGAPAGRLLSNVFGTRYELALDASVLPWDPDRRTGSEEGAPGAGAGGGPSAPLVDVQYKTRLKGFMRPRRMKVSLPRAAELDRFCCAEGLVAERAEAAALAALDGGGDHSDGGAPPADDEAFAGPGMDLDSMAPPGSPRFWRGMSFSANGRDAAKREGEQAWGVQLRNKPPHWNDSLRCWCLNFRGRVKLASVKNFQLISVADPTKAIAMQFGKVDANTYIMDFNPTIVSAAQAFAVALSTFDTKVLL